MNNKRGGSVITILTDPIPSPAQLYSHRLKNTIRPLLRRLDGKKPLKKPAYGGHFAVTRSLLEGLQKAGRPFVYNPSKRGDCTEDVIVLAGLATLEQAIGLRREGIIKRLAAGPNIVVVPSDAPEAIGSAEIDRVIVNSEWVSRLYALDAPGLEEKLVVWPAGVDEADWKPDRHHKNPVSLLFYSKRPDQNLFAKCKQLAEDAGFPVTVLEYGSYTPQQYKQLLNEHATLVHFTPSESQGISLAESWSMDVPTIVWNPGTLTIKEMTVVSSSAPYLSADTGVEFSDAAGFDSILQRLKRGDYRFQPRKWILENQTDKRSAMHLIKLLGF